MEKTPIQRAKLAVDESNFAFSAYRTCTHSASSLNQDSDGQKAAIARITHYCMKQVAISQPNNQQIKILFSLATQVKLKQLLVNSRLIRPQPCRLLLALRGSFLWLN